MGLDKIVYNTKYTPVVNIKLSAISAAMGRAKMYELLHKQIWRKTRLMWPTDGPNYNHSRVPVYTMPGLATFNGRPVAFIQHWDIKSPSVSPYGYDTAIYPSGGTDMRFGLNQLFVEQDPFKPYVGNPKSGIYHDDCYIIPKMMPVSAEHYYWVYTNNDEYASDRKLFRERDDDGVVVVENVVLENYVATVAGKTQDRHRLVVTYVGGAVDRVDLGSGTYQPFMQKVEKRISHDVLGHVDEYKVDYDFSSRGAVIWEQVIDMPYQFTTTSSQATTQEDGWIRQYSDGTVIQYRPLEVEYWGDGMNNIIPGHYKILPMVYTDTGDLTMPVADFVNNWTDYFELVVHEDSEWWESFLAPITAIVSIVVAWVAWPLVMGMGPVLGPIMGGALIAGTAMSVMGTLGGNAKLAALGGLISGVASLAGSLMSAGRNAIGQAAFAAGHTVDTAAKMAAEATLGSVFSNFVSAGFSNLATIGSNILKVTTSMLSLSADDVTEEVEVEEVIEASQIEFTTRLGPEKTEYDVFGQMSKQFEMY